MWPPGSTDTVCPRPPLTLTSDRLTLKLVCESHLRWETVIPNLGTLGFGFSNYSLCTRRTADRRTNRQTDGQKQRLLPPTVGGITIGNSVPLTHERPLGATFYSCTIEMQLACPLTSHSTTGPDTSLCNALCAFNSAMRIYLLSKQDLHSAA